MKRFYKLLKNKLTNNDKKQLDDLIDNNFNNKLQEKYDIDELELQKMIDDNNKTTEENNTNKTNIYLYIISTSKKDDSDGLFNNNKDYNMLVKKEAVNEYKLPKVKINNIEEKSQQLIMNVIEKEISKIGIDYWLKINKTAIDKNGDLYYIIETDFNKININKEYTLLRNNIQQLINDKKFNIKYLRDYLH